MKAKYLFTGVAALVLMGGLWFGRAAWRAHRQLVTLDVRETPLAKALRSIERQTWTKINAEKSLARARISLRVKNMPLQEVLDRIGEQAGAHWSTLYAVYDSERALTALNTALNGDGKLGAAGWKKIAPTLPPPGPSEDEPPTAALRKGPEPGAAGQMKPVTGMVMARGAKNGPVVFFGGPGGNMEEWSPEALVIESSLRNRVEAKADLEPTPQAASEVARSARGKWKTLIALSKSSMGVGFRAPRGRPKPGQGPRAPDPYERFANLTPQQRVQQARERLGIPGE